MLRSCDALIGLIIIGIPLACLICLVLAVIIVNFSAIIAGILLILNYIALAIGYTVLFFVFIAAIIGFFSGAG